MLNPSPLAISTFTSNEQPMKWLDLLVFSKRIDIRILRHVLFWSLDCASILVVISAESELTPAIVLSRILVVPLTAATTYFIIYYVIPSFSRDRNRVKLWVCLLFAFLFIAYAIRFYRLAIIYPLMDPTHLPTPDRWSFIKVFRDTFRWMPGICMAVAIKIMKTKAELQQQTEHLIQEKKEAELALLKARMHPHFLFNTLNTLYSYSLKKDDKSEQIVLRLSNLMRYILEECDKRTIPVEKEIKVIEDYFTLEKLRHDGRLNIDCKIKLDGSKVFISPLLLLPIIENSCKHTLSSNRGQIDIVVRINSENNFIKLFVENAMPNGANSSLRFGGGLSSLSKQLHLQYRNQFTFETDQRDNKFTVNLKVPALYEEQD